jgi:hypothetical protein
MPPPASAVDAGGARAFNLLPPLRTVAAAGTAEHALGKEWEKMGNIARIAQALRLEISEHSLKDFLEMDAEARKDTSSDERGTEAREVKAIRGANESCQELWAHSKTSSPRKRGSKVSSLTSSPMGEGGIPFGCFTLSTY